MADPQQYFDDPEFVKYFTAVRRSNLFAPIEWIIDQFNASKPQQTTDEKPQSKKPKKA
jgi:hypothetical protein